MTECTCKTKPDQPCPLAIEEALKNFPPEEEPEEWGY